MVGYGADAADDAGGRRLQSRGVFWAPRIIADSTDQPTGSKVPNGGWFLGDRHCARSFAGCRQAEENRSRLAAGQEWRRSRRAFARSRSCALEIKDQFDKNVRCSSGRTGRSVSSLWICCDAAMEFGSSAPGGTLRGPPAASLTSASPVPAPAGPTSRYRRGVRPRGRAPVTCGLWPGARRKSSEPGIGPARPGAPVATTDAHSVTAIGVSRSGASHTPVARLSVARSVRAIVWPIRVVAGMVARTERARLIDPPGITRRSRFVTITERG